MPSGDAGEQTYLAIKIEQYGVSRLGASQFASGQPVADPRDRLILARVMGAAFDVIARQIGPAALALLLPAVQTAR
jgi:hypothetical protein